MFEKIRIVKHQAKPCSEAEVDTAAAQLGVRFPLGYREYVTRFGAGVLGGTLVRIYPPSRILRDLGDWRARIDECWFLG